MSDHMKIKFSLRSDRPQITPFRNPRKTNWLSYKKKLERKLSEWSVSTNNVLEIEESVVKLTKSIIKVFEESCPLSRRRSKAEPIWFPSDLVLAWRKFCGMVEGVSASARMHKILSKDRSDQVSSLRLPNGEYTQDESELLDNLFLFLFPGSIDANVNKVPMLTDENWVSEEVRSL